MPTQSRPRGALTALLASMAVVGSSLALALTASPATAAPATSLAVGICPSVTAGLACTVSVRARDNGNATDRGYLGTVRFTSTDPAATLPANYTFTAGDAGTTDIIVVFATPGAQRVTVTDTSAPSVAGQSGATTVHADAADRLRVGSCPAVTAGKPCALTVAVLNTRGDKVAGYRGTVRFTSTDPDATLPANYTFTVGDAGMHDFNVAFATPGAQRVTVTDAATPSVTGTSGATNVAADDVTTFLVSVCPNTPPGAACAVRVDARNARVERVPGYRGTVRFTSTDPAATLPADYTFTAGDAGLHDFSVVFRTAGSQRIAATDVATASITGSATTTVMVSPTTTSSSTTTSTTSSSTTTSTTMRPTTTSSPTTSTSSTTTSSTTSSTTSTTVPSDPCATPTGPLSGAIEASAVRIGTIFGLRAVLHDLAVQLCRLGL